MPDEAFMLEDYRLTTAEILYHLRDDPESLQTYTWRSLDRVPDFPKLNEFLDLWENSLEGELHSVRIAIVGDPVTEAWQYSNALMTLH